VNFYCIEKPDKTYQKLTSKIPFFYCGKSTAWLRIKRF